LEARTAKEIKMKVTDRPTIENQGAAANSATGSVQKKDKVSPKRSEKISSRDELSSAKVKLSDRAQDMKKIRSAVDAAPDADEAKIAKFKSLIANGDYKVDAKAVADKMVDEHAYNDFFTPSEE
jgi:negative regulator of flagellin synthesis FlgM